MWDLPAPGIELVSPALAGRFPTTVPLGKSLLFVYLKKKCIHLFIFGCVGSSLLHAGLLQLRRGGLLFVMVSGLLIAVATLVAEHRLQARGPQQLWHMGSAVVARKL